MVEILISKWFLVPIENDDVKMALQFTDLMIMLNRNIKKPAITTYRIHPTTDCNARCFYCYELGCNRRDMSEQTAHDIADFIEKKSLGERVRIAWFGGEPLYNAKVIDIISNDLKKKGVEYVSTMISNGYLFDKENIEKANTLWNLKHIQITLDGTEKIYNKIKAHIYKDVNAFQIVTDNIENLLQSGIPVQIRMNMDQHNEKDLFELTEYLHKRFGNYKKFGIYAHLLFEDSSEKIKNRSDEDRQLLYDKFIQLQSKLYSYGYAKTRPLNNNDLLTHCQGDSDSATMILPGGELGKCEHYVDDHYYGSIYSDKIDKKIIDDFKEVICRSPKCDKCALRQKCLVLKMCNSIPKRCDEIDEMIRWQSIRGQMRVTYAQYTKDENLRIASAIEG